MAATETALVLEQFVSEIQLAVPTVAVWAHGSLALGDFQPGRSDVVHPNASLPLRKLIGSRDAQNLVFAAGHMWLAVSSAAHKNSGHTLADGLPVTNTRAHPNASDWFLDFSFEGFPWPLLMLASKVTTLSLSW